MRPRVLPLKYQILILIGTLGICILFISLYSMHSYSSLQTATIHNNQTLFSSHVQQSAEKSFEEIKNIASSIAYNQLVQQYLVEVDAQKKFNLYGSVINLLNNTKSLNNSILDIAVLGETKNTANLSGDISLYKSIYGRLPDDNLPIHFLDKSTLYIGNKAYTCQIAAMPIYQLSTTAADFIGILYIAIDPSTILGDNLYTGNSIPTELLFVNSKEQLIVGNEKLYEKIRQRKPKEDSFNIESENQTYNCQRNYIKNADGALYTLVNQSVYSRKIDSMVLHQSFLIIITFLAAVIILLTFFKPINRSLEQLTEIMNNISKGMHRALNERIRIDLNCRSCKEVYSIATSFNDMLNEINYLNHHIFNTYSQMYELELINRKTEIAFLRSQINPHFLYNTLTLICGMASEHESGRIIDIAQALSQIYRYSIKGNDIVSLSQELEIVKYYVMIQTSRFEDRFTVKYDFTEEIFNALIPRMIIQPIVENAITHGLEKSMRKGSLTIGGRKNTGDNTLVLWVYDTGIGMTREHLLQIRKRLNDTAAKRTGGLRNNTIPMDFKSNCSIGLYNVNSRIYLYYGEPYKLHIDSEENVGTNVQIKIPFHIN